MTMLTPEQKARQRIDDLLQAADWSVQARERANLPEPKVLAADIVEDLESALEQFRVIAEDLGA
ncbi:MAG: hypothetical protein PVF04_02805 [Anaerolineae bacterium]|jgi:hypothetical protein